MRRMTTSMKMKTNTRVRGGDEDEEDVSYEDKRSKVKAVSKSAAK